MKYKPTTPKRNKNEYFKNNLMLRYLKRMLHYIHVAQFNPFNSGKFRRLDFSWKCMSMHDKILLAKLHAKIDESAKKIHLFIAYCQALQCKEKIFQIYLDMCVVKKRREDVIKCSWNAVTYLVLYLDKNDWTYNMEYYPKTFCPRLAIIQRMSLH